MNGIQLTTSTLRGDCLHYQNPDHQHDHKPENTLEHHADKARQNRGVAKVRNDLISPQHPDQGNIYEEILPGTVYEYNSHSLLYHHMHGHAHLRCNGSMSHHLQCKCSSSAPCQGNLHAMESLRKKLYRRCYPIGPSHT